MFEPLPAKETKLEITGEGRVTRTMEVTERLLKGTGRYLMFLLLNGLGGALLADITTFMIVDNFPWVLGQPETGATFGAVVQVINWGLWGSVGALVAAGGSSVIFKQFPPRWMGITTISILIFSRLGIFSVLLIKGKIELDAWRDFAHATAAVGTFWYLFRLPPFSRSKYDGRSL